MMRGMVIDINDEQLDALAQLRAFLDGTAAVDFAVAADERYDFIARTVRRFVYRHLKRADKGVVLRFLERVREQRGQSNGVRYRLSDLQIWGHRFGVTQIWGQVFRYHIHPAIIHPWRAL